MNSPLLRTSNVNLSARPWIIRSKFLSGLARWNASVLEGLFLFSLAKLVDRPKQRRRRSPLKYVFVLFIPSPWIIRSLLKFLSGLASWDSLGKYVLRQSRLEVNSLLRMSRLEGRSAVKFLSGPASWEYRQGMNVDREWLVTRPM